MQRFMHGSAVCGSGKPGCWAQEMRRVTITAVRHIRPDVSTAIWTDLKIRVLRGSREGVYSTTLFT